MGSGSAPGVGAAVISYCWDPDVKHGKGGTVEKGRCKLLGEVMKVFVQRCLYRGKLGGFVKVLEPGKWGNSTVSAAV